MTEAQHTPGPWLSEDKVDDRGGWYEPRQQILITGPKGALIANYTTEFMEYPDDDVNAANARLIAAAPDMLDALSGLLKAIEGSVSGDWAISFVAIETARAAIAKATGA